MSENQESILLALQKLTPKGVIQRTATCPTHLVKSSKFVGEVVKVIDGRSRHVWVFQCKYLGKLNWHNFVAFPDRNAPKQAEQLPFWKDEQALARIGESQKKWQ